MREVEGGQYALVSSRNINEITAVIGMQVDPNLPAEAA